MDSEVAAVVEDLRTLHRSDPAAADRAIGARLIGLGWQWSWHGLGTCPAANLVPLVICEPRPPA